MTVLLGRTTISCSSVATHTAESAIVGWGQGNNHRDASNLTFVFQTSYSKHRVWDAGMFESALQLQSCLYMSK